MINDVIELMQSQLDANFLPQNDKPYICAEVKINGNQKTDERRFYLIPVGKRVRISTVLSMDDFNFYLAHSVMDEEWFPERTINNGHIMLIFWLTQNDVNEKAITALFDEIGMLIKRIYNKNEQHRFVKRHENRAGIPVKKRTPPLESF
jgi:hypothetical protein